MEALIQKASDAEPCNEACKKQMFYRSKRLCRWFHPGDLTNRAGVRNGVGT